MKKRIERGGVVYRLRFFVNGWEEGGNYFRSVGNITEAEMLKMAYGETINKNGNEYRIAYESEYGNEVAVSEIDDTL